MPAGKANKVLQAVRVSSDIAKQIDKAVQASNQGKPDWIREAITERAENPPIWVKIKWTLEELSGKLVEFRLTTPTYRVSGVGKFRVIENEKGLLAIDIIVETRVTQFKFNVNRYWIGQEIADKIEIHPIQAKAHFRLLA